MRTRAQRAFPARALLSSRDGGSEEEEAKKRHLGSQKKGNVC